MFINKIREKNMMVIDRWNIGGKNVLVGGRGGLVLFSCIAIFKIFKLTLVESGLICKKNA